MWRDESGAVHTLAPEDPWALVQGDLAKRIAGASPEEITVCRKMLNRLDSEAFDEAVALEIDESEQAFRQLPIPPVPHELSRLMGLSLQEALGVLVHMVTPRWRLDAVEALDDLLDRVENGEAP